MSTSANGCAVCSSRLARGRRGIVLPVILILAMILAVIEALVLWRGIIIRPSLPVLMVAPGIAFAVAYVYSTLRPKPPIAELFICIGLMNFMSAVSLTASGNWQI